jgi:pimeloyl-ACP methyl ester carboxylesterase
MTAAAPLSRWVDLDGPVHYVDHGGPDDGPLLVCVHGLGGSHVNWAALAPLLTDTARVLAVDLAGFGLTRAVGRSASVTDNQELLARFLRTVADGPVVLVGNSMGGLICAMQAGAHPESVAAVVLIDPAVPIALRARLDPTVTAMFAAVAVPPLARVTWHRRRIQPPEDVAMSLLRLCCVDPGRVPADVVAQHIELARTRRQFPEIDEAMITAAGSMVRTLARRRHYGELLRRLAGPVMLLHGAQDRLVQLAAVEAVARDNPRWRFHVADNVGHVPQLEVPEWTAARIRTWLATEAKAAAERTRHTTLTPGTTEPPPMERTA